MISPMLLQRILLSECFLLLFAQKDCSIVQCVLAEPEALSIQYGREKHNNKRNHKECFSDFK